MHRRKQKFESFKIISSPISIFLASLGHATDKKKEGAAEVRVVHQQRAEQAVMGSTGNLGSGGGTWRPQP